MPPSLPPAPDGCGWWGISLPKGPESPSPESRREAPPEARLRGRGETRLALRWFRRPFCRSPPRTLPSPARVEFGCCARGRRGYEGFESAQAAEWSSPLFPPPATGLNFCKFKLNGAFFCCLPEGACNPPRAALGRERPPGARRPARGEPASRTRARAVRPLTAGRRLRRCPGSETQAPGLGDPGTGPRPPPPLPG